jgi:hypothetical protein
MRAVAQKKLDDLKGDTLTRIRALQITLDGIKQAVKDDERHLNDLGEVQGLASMLDCRIAAMATLRMLLEEPTGRQTLCNKCGHVGWDVAGEVCHASGVCSGIHEYV